MESLKEIAKILRIDQDILKNLDAKCSKASGKTGILDAFWSENQMLVEKSLNSLGIDRKVSLKILVEKLEQKVSADEEKVKQILNGIRLTERADCEKILKLVNELLLPREGMFLKKEKAVELLKKNPPQKVLAFLGYANIDEALKKEDLFELFASMRFGEERDWLNNVFFKEYEKIQPSDFEKRKIHFFVFSQKFAPLAQHFIEKKYHNLSHLKELGAIFMVPFGSENLSLASAPGQLMKAFSLVFHYFHEVPFYSDMFEGISGQPNFSQGFVSLLRGDVPEPKLDLESSSWSVTQRYLEKDDPFDLGLMVPHVNPESLHWGKAQNDIAKINQDFAFWNNLDWVGEYFKDEVGEDDLVSFNLVDVAMNLADKGKGKFYTYHQREAMWNKLFASYFGWEVLEKKSRENLIFGEIKI